MEEAAILCRYLLNRSIPPGTADKYSDALQKLVPPFTDDRERKLWDFALKHPFLLRYIDGGSAVVYPYGGIRYRLYILSALLETDVQTASLYLDKKHGMSAHFRVGFAGLNALFGLFIGFTLVKIWQKVA